MKPRLCIRTDGNSVMGLGHVMRCIAISKMAEPSFRIVFYCAEIPPQIAKEIILQGFEFNKISSDAEFLSLIDSTDQVIIDGYQFTSDFQIEIKKTGATLICIDDLHDKKYHADLIINHSPGISAGDYSAEISTQFALGKDYVLLRPAFLKAASETDSATHDLQKVFICFGGADPRNMTQEILKIVSAKSEFTEINVVTGSAYVNSEHIQQIADEDKRISYFQSADENTMLGLMLRCGVAIVPSGGILLECIAAGCSIISGLYVSNQKFIYSNYLKAGTFTDAGDFSEAKVMNAIDKVLSHPALQTKFFDGNSGKRIEKLLVNIFRSKEITLRKAGSGDTETTFQWANDPVIRQHSFNKSEIKKEEHIAWFQKRIQSPDCIYLIAEKNATPVGSIRFDISSDDALISYLIEPEFHGKGYGQAVLSKGLKFIRDLKKSSGLSVRTISGKVFRENISSMKAFERTGFIIAVEEKEYVTFRKNIAA